MFAITKNKHSPTLKSERIYKYRNKNIFLNIFLSFRHIYIIIRKTKCFVTAKRNVLFAKRSVYKKELLLYCDTRGTLGSVNRTVSRL